jgi:Fic family protein
MSLFDSKDRITNNDVEHLLGVSDSTATRYLQALEDQHKITQVGTTGVAVYYVKK